MFQIFGRLILWSLAAYGVETLVRKSGAADAVKETFKGGMDSLKAGSGQTASKPEASAIGDLDLSKKD